ncbi:hypothetical protein ACEQ8H_002184 [Pleosporales sp. CAS-2024a]
MRYFKMSSIPLSLLSLLILTPITHAKEDKSHCEPCNRIGEKVCIEGSRRFNGQVGFPSLLQCVQWGKGRSCWASGEVCSIGYECDMTGGAHCEKVERAVEHYGSAAEQYGSVPEQYGSVPEHYGSA